MRSAFVTKFPISNCLLIIHINLQPCQICAVGVLECMPLAAAYGLDEVYRKSLRWVTRHFVRIWPCKAFATLPKELMAKCYHQHIVHMVCIISII